MTSLCIWYVDRTSGERLRRPTEMLYHPVVWGHFLVSNANFIVLRVFDLVSCRQHGCPRCWSSACRCAILLKGLLWSKTMSSSTIIMAPCPWHLRARSCVIDRVALVVLLFEQALPWLYQFLPCCLLINVTTLFILHNGKTKAFVPLSKEILRSHVSYSGITLSRREAKYYIISRLIVLHAELLYVRLASTSSTWACFVDSPSIYRAEDMEMVATSIQSRKEALPIPECKLCPWHPFFG
jgi:hypothetical protein